jgi:hypothetical protein
VLLNKLEVETSFFVVFYLKSIETVIIIFYHCYEQKGVVGWRSSLNIGGQQSLCVGKLAHISVSLLIAANMI